MLGGKAVFTLPNYLCFTALEDGTFTLTIPSGLATSNLSYVEYSVNEGQIWVKTDNIDNEAVTITTSTVETGGKVYWRGSGLRGAVNDSSGTTFSSTCRFDVSGNILSLLQLNFESSTSLNSRAFLMLFNNCTTLINAKDCIFPNFVAERCYHSMFKGCSNLITAPVLPATNCSSSYCYYSMFQNCASLTETPTLPATSVGFASYQAMFAGCTSLTKVTELNAMSLGSQAYWSMFESCTSLKTPQHELPATNLSTYCYRLMFAGSGIESAPIIRATTLGNSTSHFEYMFYRCKKLKVGPDINILVLKNYTCANMYRESNVTYVKMLATDISATNCLREWMRSVPDVSTSIFVKHIDAQWTTTGMNGVPTNWTVIYYDPAVDKYYTDQTRATECDEHGNPI